MDKPLRLLVGCYADWDEESVFLYELSQNGELRPTSSTKGGKKASFMATSPSNDQLFVVNESEDFDEKGHGALSIFKIDPDEGIFSLQTRISSYGKLPVHCLALDSSFVSVANYESGSVALFPYDSAGLSEPLFVRRHDGRGPHPERQRSAHAHQSVLSPDEAFLFVPDLGTDQILRYLRSSTSGLISEGVAYNTHSGWGPRHLVFHPDGQRAYLVHELKSAVSALAYRSGREWPFFEESNSEPTIPPSFGGTNKCGAIALSPDGRHLYVSNRGHDSIAVFHTEGFMLNSVSFEKTRGSWPRDFALDPTGHFLVVANQRSGTLVSFFRNKIDGSLEFSGHTAALKRPVFVCFL